MFRRVCFVVLIIFSLSGCVASSSSKDKASWFDMAMQWKTPSWFEDAKFGIWLHWGPQSIPKMGGGWYARHLYQPDPGRESWGKNAYQYHVKTYGHPSKYGYKELCRDWKAEYFDADVMVQQFQDWGARYVAVLANHHDNFDLYDSDAQPWNSVNIGPKKNIVGEFCTAARKRNLPVEVSVHCARSHSWFAPSASSDKSGPLKGVAYDGALNKEDGKGLWWEGMDPHLLYANRLSYSAFKKNFKARLMQLVTDYEPDVLYFDDALIPLGSSGWEPCAELYRRSLEKNGKIDAIVTVKLPQIGTMLDLEMGGSVGIRKHPFQVDTTLASDWFNKEDKGEDNLIHDVRSLTETLVDTVSKNGTLLLNIAVLGNGKIPQRQANVMNTFSIWLKEHEEAIFKTRPWLTYGEDGAFKSCLFSQRTRETTPWDFHVVRYTKADDKNIYAFIFGNPKNQTIRLNSFAKGKVAQGLSVDTIKAISKGYPPTSDKAILERWTQDQQGIVLSFGEGCWPNCNVVKISLK